MSVQKVTCKACGYQAYHTQSNGGKGGVSHPEGEMRSVCKNYGSGSLGLGCENFDKALSEPRRSR